MSTPRLDQAPYAVDGLEKLMMEIAALPRPQECPFSEAELWSPFEYVRGSQYLDMPRRLKALLVLPP